MATRDVDPTCDPNTMPEITSIPGIPEDISVYAISGGTNTTIKSSITTAMTACCAPNPLHVAEDCYLWCEIPYAYINGSTTDSEVSAAFSSCLQMSGMMNERQGIAGTRVVRNAAATRGDVTTNSRLGLWALVVCGVLLSM